MELLFRLIVYVSSVWISTQYADGTWVVGPVFGLAVVSYDSNTFRNLVLPKHLAFVAASSLVYALVYRVSIGKWGGESDLVNYFVGPFPSAVVLGSVLLPLAHRKILGGAAFIPRVIAALILSFYAVTIFVFFNDKMNWGLTLNFIAVSIAVWQGLYLYFFFAKSRR